MARFELIVTVQDGENVNARTLAGAVANGKVAMDPLIRRTIAVFEVWLRAGKISRADELKVLGMHLYRAIFNGRVEELFKTTLAKVRKPDRLRVQLSFQPGAAELASMPWEYLYSPDTDTQAGFCFATNLDLVLSRYIPPTSDPDPKETPQSSESKVRILVVVSQPKDLGAVIADPVIDQIKKLQEKLPIELSEHRDATLDSLVDKIEEVKPNVVHFIGHGRFNREEKRGQIALLAETGDAHWCPDEQFASVFTQAGALPRLVFLHLCESATVEFGAFSSTFAGLAPRLIQAEIPAVVAMQYPITNQAAIAFSRAFYESLGKGRTIDDAVQEGRYRITLRIPDAVDNRVFGTPVLYMRGREGTLLPQSPLAGAAGAQA